MTLWVDDPGMNPALPVGYCCDYPACQKQITAHYVLQRTHRHARWFCDTNCLRHSEENRDRAIMDQVDRDIREERG